MIPSVVEHEVLIDAPRHLVWEVITDAKHVSQWFSETAEIDLRPGGTGTLTWPGHPASHLTIEQVERPRLFSFRWVYPQGQTPKEGNSMLVVFTLTPEGERTRLHVAETGLREIDWSDADKLGYAKDHTDGWRKHFGDLAVYAVSVPR